MMFMDSPMSTFTKNDGIVSLMHCKEWDIRFSTSSIWILKIINEQKLVWRFHQKLKCEMLVECIAYTFEQQRLKCNLHSNIEKGQKYIRGKQTGLKKPDYILSLPEISLCSEKNRKRRCRREPKCQHVNCLRTAQECYSRR